MDPVAELFSCTRCGYCCRGEVTVSLDREDQERMCLELGLSREEVRSRFWRVTGTVVQMKTVDGHCIFYNNGCSIHQGRPHRCGQWPLHPAILAGEENLQTIRESCPGVNRELSYKEFCERLRIVLQDDRLFC